MEQLTDIYQYIIARKGYRIYCIRFTESWQERLIDYLLDNQARIKPATEYNYIKLVDENGMRCCLRSFDSETREFDIPLD